MAERVWLAISDSLPVMGRRHKSRPLQQGTLSHGTRARSPRHEPRWCARLQGQEDPPLNARGVLQAAALAAALQREPIERIYTSDLRRVLHTAQAVAGALGHGQGTVVALPSLRERHLGILQARRAGRLLVLAGSRC